MFKAPDSPYLVPFDGSFKLKNTTTEPPSDRPSKKKCQRRLADLQEELDELQRMLYAHDKYGVLLVFQAMDAAGKDSTIRAVMTGIDPAGCQVFSFKQPSKEELDHDFLWRTARRLPERGRIGIFNRSYYEEVLVVKVHPEYLKGQKLPYKLGDMAEFWQGRYESIRDHEKHLARNGMVIVKFFLNVSLEEQRQRFLSRLDEPEKNWKFATGDVKERGHWKDYQRAYEEALNATSKEFAPWYAIPADSKSFMRMTVAEIVVDTLKSLDLRYPEVHDSERQHFDEMRELLTNEG